METKSEGKDVDGFNCIISLLMHVSMINYDKF